MINNSKEMTRKKQLSDLLKDSPEDSFLLFAMAKEFENEENYEEACNYYSKIQQFDAKYVGMYYHYAHALIELEEDENKIMEIFKQGIEMATQLNDLHAKAELQNAFTNWEMENL